MKVRIIAFASFREILGKEVEVDLTAGKTLRDLLGQLEEGHPRLHEEVYLPSGDLKETTIIMLNRVNIDSKGGLDATLKEGDELAIFPPFAGG